MPIPTPLPRPTKAPESLACAECTCKCRQWRIPRQLPMVRLLRAVTDAHTPMVLLQVVICHIQHTCNDYGPTAHALHTHVLKWLIHTGPASTHYGAPRQPSSELPFQESDPLRFHPRNSHPVCVKQLLVSNYMRHTYKEVRPDVPSCSAWREISICGDNQNGGNKVQIN